MIVALTKVTRLDDLWSGEMARLVVEGTAVLLINIEDAVFAYRDACPHRGTPLSAGSLAQAILTCATHHWQFDACSGAGINPEGASLEVFPVAVENGDIYVDVGSPRAAGAARPEKGTS